MTSEEPIDVVKKPDEKKSDDCSNFAKEIPEHKETSREIEKQRSLRSHELMRLVYELPEELKKPDIIENSNMLKENPPITIVEITEQNGCETEFERQCDDSYYNSSPELGNKVVYDVLATNELIMQCTEEFKEVIERTSPDCSDEDLFELKRLLDGKPKILERYLRECASSEEVNRIHTVTSGGPLSPRPHHEARSTSVTSDLFQLWLSSSPVKRSRSPSGSAQRQLDEADLFMDLIKDVANELDIDVLCHKILVNVCLLTSADRGSLFLAKGTPPKRYLQAKLFDVTRDTELSDALRTARTQEIKIPFGVGVAGLAAQTKHPINIRNAYADPRFNSEIDARTGYKTELILCMPICNYEGDVVGVAQIINKTDGSKEFSPRDVEVFRRYLTFCGIGIQNAQLFESSVLEYKRNQILLALARSIFEEQSNLECLVTKIMTEARELLKCERCSVFILDTDHCESSHLERIVQRPGGHRSAIPALPPPAPTRFHTQFELGAHQSRTTLTPRHDHRSALASIALTVAQSNKALNISNVVEWLQENNTAVLSGADDAANIRTMLCMPIVNANKDVIGVAQLINKENGSQFTDGDISIFEAFAIFCGLGIHNTQMYENACKLMAKQKVALECLSYHATASTEDTSKLCQDFIPSSDTYNLYSFHFHDFDLSDEDTCRATLRMFLQCNLVEKFHIPYEVLCRWILSVKKNYRPVKYHNWRHALNVAQTMFAMLKTGKMERFMSDLEILGLLVACLCHDLDHRGTNNAFQTKTESPLAILYSTSTMEHHHFDQCVMILNSESNNIFQALSPSDYKDVMRVVETAILSTDLAMYFKKKSKFLELVDNGEFDWQSREKKELLCGMMMTACDVSAIAKPWEVQHKVAKLVADEFFDQGDLEKLQLNQQPIAMMDREKKDELPQMQVGFIDMICLPLYKVLTDTFPWIEPLYTGTMENRQRWQDLAEKVEMGLTWIDHDTIDKPIEEFTALNEPIKDVEFTVTTLNCSKATPESTSSTALVKPIKTSFHSLRRGKSSNFTSRPARNKLTRSLYAAPSTQREGEKEKAIVKKATMVTETNNHTTVVAEEIEQPVASTKTRHKGRLCHML